jgi:hypothetical protein
MMIDCKCSCFSELEARQAHGLYDLKNCLHPNIRARCNKILQLSLKVLTRGYSPYPTQLP